MDELSDELLGPITIDLGNVDTSNSTYISGSSGIDTITLDPLWATGSITSANTLTWAQPYNYSITGSTNINTSTVSIDTDGMTLQESCDIKIGDRSLKDFMDSVEQRLGILRPNPDLEEKWDQLKELRNKYKELEKDILEKEKIMKILKDNK
jgi:hypothetical protein